MALNEMATIVHVCNNLEKEITVLLLLNIQTYF